MSSMNITEYNKEKEFSTKIKPQLDKIMYLCSIHKIPFFYTACVANSEKDGSVYKSDVSSAVSHNITLADDRISRHIDVSIGFDAVPSRADMEIDTMDEIASEYLDDEEEWP